LGEVLKKGTGVSFEKWVGQLIVDVDDPTLTFSVNHNGPNLLQNNLDNWFWWRGCKVDEKLIHEFSDEIASIVSKLKDDMNHKIDYRIQALQILKKEGEIQAEKVTKFFNEVFVKFLYLKKLFPSMRSEEVFYLLKGTHMLEKHLFIEKCEEIKQNSNDEKGSKIKETFKKNTRSLEKISLDLDKSDTKIRPPLPAHQFKVIPTPTALTTDQPIDLSKTGNAEAVPSSNLDVRKEDKVEISEVREMVDAEKAKLKKNKRKEKKGNASRKVAAKKLTVAGLKHLVNESDIIAETAATSTKQNNDSNATDKSRDDEISIAPFVFEEVVGCV